MKRLLIPIPFFTDKEGHSSTQRYSWSLQNHSQDLIEMLLFRAVEAFTAHLIDRLLSKLMTLFPNRLVDHRNRAIAHLLNLSVAERPSAVEPDAFLVGEAS